MDEDICMVYDSIIAKGSAACKIQNMLELDAGLPFSWKYSTARV
jgi:hypothetical protein